MRLSNYKVITKEREIELAKKFEQGDLKARDKLVEANARFVAKLANSYGAKMIGIDIEELIQCGMIGLLRAVERYDWRLGVPLHLYSIKWINSEMLQSISVQRRTIRVPFNVEKDLWRYKKRRREVYYFGGKNEEEEDAHNLSKILSIPVAEVNKNDGYGLTNLYDEKFSPDTDQSEIDGDVLRIIDTLPIRERMIIYLRRGLDGLQERTLSQVSESVGITLQWVHQLERQAMEDIKSEYDRIKS